MPRAETILWYLNLAATHVLLCRLVYCKLHRVYPALFLYALGQAVVSLTLLQIPINGDLYFYAYAIGQLLSLVLSVFVVQELYRVALVDHPALSVFGRRSMLAVLAVAGVLAAAGAGLDSAISPGQYWRINRFLTVDRTAEFILLIFLLAISAFLLWFPVTIRRNIAVYIAGFVIFYFSQSVAFLLHNMLGQPYAQAVSAGGMAMSFVSLLIWLVGVRAEGSSPAIVTGHSRNPSEISRLTLQLDEINAALAKFVKTSSH